MAVCNFKFRTNVTNKKNSLYSNDVASFLFEKKDGNVAIIEPGRMVSIGLFCGEFSGTWTGLEARVCKRNGELIKRRWSPSDEEVYDMLKNSKLVAFSMDEELLAKNGYDVSVFTPTCERIELSISIGNESPLIFKESSLTSKGRYLVS